MAGSDDGDDRERKEELGRRGNRILGRRPKAGYVRQTLGTRVVPTADDFIPPSFLLPLERTMHRVALRNTVRAAALAATKVRPAFLLIFPSFRVLNGPVRNQDRCPQHPCCLALVRDS